MNRERRKAIERARGVIEANTQQLLDIRGAMSQVVGDLEVVRDEEQESFDNLPESMQGAEKGEKMENAVDNLYTVISALEEMVDAIPDDFYTIFDALEAASE
jgi:hypothetical protein